LSSTEHRAPGQQGRALEEDGDVAAWRGDGPAVDQHLARRRWQQPGDQAQEGGFAAAGTSYDGHEFTLRRVKFDIAERFDSASGIGECP
jgi:hypothetical protein